jgi:hypothetical protein
MAASTGGVMKKMNRLLLGFISSLLLAAGFASAANRVDPLSSALPKSSESTLRVADGCSSLCDVSDLG